MQMCDFNGFRLSFFYYKELPTVRTSIFKDFCFNFRIFISRTSLGPIAANDQSSIITRIAIVLNP